MSAMPEPVPPGKWAEFAATISEGFCPSCKAMFSLSETLAPQIIYGQCSRCCCTWQLNAGSPAPGIKWIGHGTNGSSWDIWTFDPAAA